MKSSLTISKTYEIFIGSRFMRSESGRYYSLKNSRNKIIFNICRSSTKDFENAVIAARKGFLVWSSITGYNRGQILYRMAEILEAKKMQFKKELIQQGIPNLSAKNEVERSIDSLIYYAGWADKFQQIFSTVNPVEEKYFNFTIPEPMGVLAIIAPKNSSLLGLISSIAPTILGGNTCVVLASELKPLSSISFAEIINSSDVPEGVINILTGYKKDLITPISSHMDINAVIYTDNNPREIKEIQKNAASNLKRVVLWKFNQHKKLDEKMGNPYRILDTHEIKTIWHPIGL